MFDEDGNTNIIHHENVLINTKELENKTWIMNHPTLCYKKSAILSIGNYEKTRTNKEDYQLEIKLLNKFGILYNIPQILVHYRLHKQQITFHNN